MHSPGFSCVQGGGARVWLCTGRWGQGLVVYRGVGPGFSCVQGGGARV